jgi:hypothetical protein
MPPRRAHLPLSFLATLLLAGAHLGAATQEEKDSHRSLNNEDPAVRKLIETLKTEKGAVVRRGTLSVLANLGPKAKSAVPVIIPLMKAEGEQGSLDLDFPAQGALVCIGADAVPALIQVVEDVKNTYLFRFSAIDALRQIASNRVPEAKARQVALPHIGPSGG